MRILAIRNGDLPRPPDYGGIFWDRVLNGSRELTDEGEPAALRELMRRMGFTEAEFALLEKAEDNSNDPVNLEEIAVNAVAGRFADAEGKFTRAGPPDFDLARSIMFGARYHAAKEKIMEPIGIPEADGMGLNAAQGERIELSDVTNSVDSFV